MTDHDETGKMPEQDQPETTNGPHNDQQGQRDQQSQNEQKDPSLVERLTTLYHEKPITFAVGLMGFSALLFLLGGVVSGDLSLSSIVITP